MEASEGRTQTTQGVWMGRAKALSEKEETILVFDVEGTDSRERGEQHAVSDYLYRIRYKHSINTNGTL
jgi:hypothetical protein